MAPNTSYPVDDMVPSDREDKKDSLMASLINRSIAGLFAEIY